MAKHTREPDAFERLNDELAKSDDEIANRVRAKRGGGKLSRTETVTVRLDPKLNYLCELAARAQRRTKSSFIEWAIDSTMERIDVPGTSKTLQQLAEDLWDVDEADRLVSLAFWSPGLLTHEEQLVWKIIRTSGWFWRGSWSDGIEQVWEYHVSARSLMINRVRDLWDEIQAVAEGSKDRSEVGFLASPLKAGTALDSTAVAEPPFDPDLDSEVPF